MKILALETSTEYCSVALWQDGAINERFECVGQKHSDVLLAMVADVLRDASVKLSDINGIAFGKGPGSFTGVRIACGVAQGLALGLSLPVVGVVTLQALAQASQRDKVVVALDARMGEIYHAAYQKIEGHWLEIVSPNLCQAATAPLLNGDDWLGCGSGFAIYADVLSQRYAASLSGIDGQTVPHAAAITALAAPILTAGGGNDAALALPYYLRDNVALKTHEREAARLAAAQAKD